MSDLLQEPAVLDLGVTAKKLAVDALKVGVSIGAAKASGALAGVGASVPVEVLSGGFFLVLRGLSNILKTKFPRAFGWL